MPRIPSIPTQWPSCWYSDGYQPVRTPRQASILIVNTCGFIGPAREESYSELRRLAEAKRPGQLLIAAGCLTQRYGLEVARRVPGVDGILGTRRWMDIVQVVRELRKGSSPRTALPLAGTIRSLAGAKTTQPQCCGQAYSEPAPT